MRVENSLKNLGISLGSHIITLLINFLARTIFIYLLGAEYLGLNGLFSNILSVLSIADLGFGSVIIFNMYKPIAEDDTEKVKSLLSLYKRIYMIAGLVVLCLGLCLIPFLNFFIKDASGIQENLIVIFILFLLSSVIGYFYAYKRSIIIVTQKKRIETINTLVFTVLLNAIQLTILVISRNYIAYLAIKSVITLAENLSISIIANKKYPYIKEKAIPLTKEEKRPIYKNAVAMLSHKIGAVVLGGTDSIVISAFLGLTLVGYYSNYLLITGAVISLFLLFINSISSSVGNAIASESKEKVYSFFRKTTFALFWILCFCTTSLLCLVQPFVTLWIKKPEYLLDFMTVIVIVINFYLYISRYSIHIYKDAAGLFWNDRWKPIVEVIANIVISIILVKYLGVMGVILGTLISSLLICFWLEPHILFKNYFKKSASLYFIMFIKYSGVTLVSCLLTYFATIYLPPGIAFFVLRLVICLVVPNALFLVLFFRTDEFKYYSALLKTLSKKVFKASNVDEKNIAQDGIEREIENEDETENNVETGILYDTNEELEESNNNNGE